MKKQFIYRLWLLGVFLLLPLATVLGQAVLIKGTVRSKAGEALPGVNVVEVGTTNGAVSDISGQYSLQVSKATASLSFSYIGFKSQTIALDNRSLIDVVLEDELADLNEVVVVGYGSVKKSDLTGSVASVKVDALKEIPANSMERVLQGRTAGVQVITSSQDPGAGSTIRIRGGSSLRGSNAPLVVVDGFPLGEGGDLKQINPADIASIEVLKDASASAIYGSRGANGVIMVTTYKAKSGVTRINFSQQTTVSKFTSKLLKWDDPLLMAQLTNEEMENAGKAIIYNGQTNSQGVYYPSIEDIQNGSWPYNTQWDDVVFRKAPVSNNTSIAINSANEATSFNLSVNYLKENGVYIEDEYRKGIVNLGVNHKVNKWFTINTSNIFSRNERQNNGGLAYWRNPLWPVYNSDGSYYRTSITDFEHPLALTDHRVNNTKGLDYITSYLFDFTLASHLNFKSQVNYKYGSTVTDQYYPKEYTETGYFNNGAAYLNNWLGQDFSNENYLTYTNTLAKIHQLSVMVGQTYQNSMQRGTNMGSYDFVNEALGNENMGSGNPQKNTHSNYLTRSELLSYMGRINYSLMDKYLLTATFRADASSKFGANNQWANFPSAAVSWKMHNESFIQNLNVFDELKLRATYGKSGNQGISPYQTLSRYGTETYYSDGAWQTVIGPGYVVGYTGADSRYKVWGGIPNKDLKWETTSQVDLGVDMAFFKRRLRLTADYYDKMTYDLLRERLLAPSSSYDRIWVNDGEKRNKGFELTVEGDIIHNNDWNLTATVVYQRNREKITDLGNAVASGLQTDVNTGMEYEFSGYNFTQFRQAANILAVGQPVNVFYGYKTDGIIQSLAEGVEAGLSGDLAQPGEFKYVDINKDGTIDINDRTVIGNPNPKFSGSIDLHLSYKNFDVSLFLNGVYGNDVLYQGKIDQPDVRPLRWTLDNPNNDYPRLFNGRQLKLSDWFIEDGSYLRIQNLNVGYNFDLAKYKFIQKARIYVNASDLYTFTKFSGYDPEVELDGIYWGGYPRLSRVTFGLNLTF